MIVQRYATTDAPEWDAFVAASKNDTFLFQRPYMDYHADRFRDHSLLIRDPEGRLRALLPAHTTNQRLVSHGGLTYGGFVSGPDMKVPLMLAVFDAVASYLLSAGFQEWVYKTIPTIYHRGPAEEDRYALFLAGAALSRRDVLAVVDPRNRLPYQERRGRAINRAAKWASPVARRTISSASGKLSRSICVSATVSHRYIHWPRSSCSAAAFPPTSAYLPAGAMASCWPAY